MNMDEMLTVSDDVKAARAEVQVCGLSSFSQIECTASAVNSAGSSPPATVSQFIELAGMSVRCFQLLVMGTC